LAFTYYRRCGNVLIDFFARFPGKLLSVETIAAFGIVPGAFGLSALLLAHGSVVTGSMLAAIQFVFWATGIHFFSGDVRFYPYRPNAYVDAYDDPKSRHWLVPDTLLSHGRYSGQRRAADRTWSQSGPDVTRGAAGSRWAGRLSRRGSLRGGWGVCIVVGSTALGAIATMASGSAPGFLLGYFVIVGTVTAALAVRPHAGRLIHPVPALSYLVAALVSGIIHERSSGANSLMLEISAVQWLANGFVVIALATTLALALSGFRFAATVRRVRGRRSDRRTGAGYWRAR
jgi:hypothetical protein